MPTTVLGALGRAIATGRADVGLDDLTDGGRSIQVHGCQGATRQVEVLRDAVLHLLADDPTLREDDVLVLCPDLTRFGPLVHAVLGPSSDDGDRPAVAGDVGRAARAALSGDRADRGHGQPDGGGVLHPARAGLRTLHRSRRARASARSSRFVVAGGSPTTT